MRVLQAFMEAPGPAGGAANAAPPLAPGAPVGAPPSPFVFNITTLEGAENAQATSMSNRPNVSIPVPGLGVVNPDQMKQTLERITQLLRRLSGGADLSQSWTPDQVHTALAGLEDQYSQLGLTDEQRDSLKAALQSML